MDWRINKPIETIAPQFIHYNPKYAIEIPCLVGQTGILTQNNYESKLKSLSF